jgi:hypothetical protein
VSSIKKRSHFSIFCLLLAILIALSSVFLTGGSTEAFAVSGIWRGTIDNLWNRDENWLPGGYPNASGEIAVFGNGPVPMDVAVVGERVTAGGIVFYNDLNYSISGEAGGNLAFESASSFPATIIAFGKGQHSLSLPTWLSSDLRITNLSSNVLTLTGDIREEPGDPDHSVELYSGGPVALEGQNTYTGGTKIRGSTLLLGNNSAAGTGPISFLCATNPCQTPYLVAAIGNISEDTVLANQVKISHQLIHFKGPGSMSFTSLDSFVTASADLVITGTLNIAKLQDPTTDRNLRRNGTGTFNLNITPEQSNIGAYISNESGPGQLNLYGSGTVGRIYYRDGSGGGIIGVGDNLDVSSGVLTRSTGILTVTGVLQTGTNLPGQPDRVLSFDLNGTEPGTGYDQIVISELGMDEVLSTAQITDTVLSVAVDPNFNPPLGTEFTLINRTGGDFTSDDVIQGNFRGVPDGGYYIADGLAFQVFYTADTVTLRRCEPPVLTVTGGSPQSTMVGMPFQDRLEVTALFPNQTPAVGLPIYFSAPISGASAAFTEAMPVYTGPDGKASVAATANLIVGSYEVTAGTNRMAIEPVTFYLTNESPSPVTLDVSGFPSPTIAGVSGTFTVAIRDQSGQVFPDYTGTVLFSSNDPNADLPASYSFTPADGGQQSFTAIFYTAGSDYYLRATDTVTPTLTGEQTGIVVLPADPATMAITSGASQTTEVGTPFAAPLAVRLTDAYQNPIPGVAVTFSSPLTGPSAVFTGTNPAITDATGVASLIAGANTIVGSYLVNASVTTPGVTPADFTLTNTPGAVVELRVFGYPEQVTAGTTHPFTVTANDRYGNVNSGYRGATYSLSSDPLAILPQDYMFTAQDAGTHVFYATLKTAGIQSITIVDNRGLRGTQANIEVLAAEPASLQLDQTTSANPQSTPVGTLFPKPLAVRLTDAYGNPQAGYVITFTVPSSGASATLAGVNPQTTGADGRASVEVTANTVTGSYEVLVSTNAPGVSPFKFVLTNLAGQAASLAYISGSSQTMRVGFPFAAPLVVEVRDVYGNLVPGVWVTYSAPANGPSCILSSGGMAQTSADGKASLMVTANELPGSYTVQASVAGVVDPVLFNLTNNQVLLLPLMFR